MKNKFLSALLISAVLIAAGFFFLHDISGPSGKTTARITRIESYYDNIESEEKKDVYVDYTVEGRRYQDVPLGSYDFTMKEGKRITIRYNLDDPSRIHSGHAVIAVTVLFLCGGAGLLYGGAGLLFTGRGIKRQEA